MRLRNAAKPGFRDLVVAGLLTGARYSELAQMKVEDFNLRGRSLYIPTSKSGKARTITLTEEGVQFFSERCRGRSHRDLILTKPRGTPWKPGNQRNYFKAACKAAGIEGATFHCLRHTYASRLVMKGFPFAAIAAQLGHADTKMIEKHYGHLAPGFVADALERAMGNTGLIESTNIVGLHEATSSTRMTGT
jgi:integrase